MTDRVDQNGDDAALEEELRALPPAAADPAFRARLRERFLSGDLAPPTGRRRRLLPLAAAAAAVLAAVLAVVLWPGEEPRAPAYRIVDVGGTGSILVAGRAVPVADRAGLEAALRPGIEIRVPPTATLTVALPRTVLLDLAPGTWLTLPSTDRTAAGRVIAGELRIASGPEFAGCELTIVTPEGRAVIAGTLVSVFCADMGTCVCVLEGTARVGPEGGVLVPIPPGQRMVMPRAGGGSVEAAMDAHAEGIRRMLERIGDRFPRE